MEKMRITQEMIPKTILKMPSINDIHFPKMKSSLNLQEIRLFKNSKSTHLKNSEESTQDHGKLVRSYSMSLMTIKKDIKNNYFSKKKRLIPNHENIMCIKGQKEQRAQNFESPSKSIQSMKIALDSLEKQEINFQNNLTEGSSQQLLRNSMYPGVRFQSPEYTQKRILFLQKCLPGLESISTDGSLTVRLPKKKPLFNGKFIINKKYKEQLPDELVTRKLIWQGKEMKKIDHNLIYRDIIEKSKSEKNQKIDQVNQQTAKDKFQQFMRLSAWEFHDESSKQPKYTFVKSSRE